jgi:hypothetical protein
MRALFARPRLLEAVLTSAICLWIPSLITGCNSYSLGNLNTAAAISAPSNAVRVTDTLQLTSQAMAAGEPLTFYVNGVQGGNAEYGTITSSGLYTAPAIIPNPDTVEITSTSNMYPTAPQGKVSVAIWNPIPVLATVTPSGFTEGTTTVIVNGSKFIYGHICLRNRVGGADCGSKSRHFSAYGH